MQETTDTATEPKRNSKPKEASKRKRASGAEADIKALHKIADKVKQRAAKHWAEGETERAEELRDAAITIEKCAASIGK